MQLVGVARRRARPRATTAAIASGSSAADALDDLGGQAAAHRDGARAALLERRVVEEGVGVGVQDLVREHARLRRLARDDADLAARERVEHAARGPSASITSSRQSRSVSLTSG